MTVIARGEPEYIFPPDFAAVGNETGIILVSPPTKILEELRAITDFFFCRPVDDYIAMSDQEYRNLVLQAQREMDRRHSAQRLARENHTLISQILWCGPISAQTIRLRAARPKREQQIQEVISWHRENFYCPYGSYMLNFWMPLDNVNVSTALQYVPGSHLISDKDLKLEARRDTRITIDQQLIGLLDNVGHIVSGVDFAKAEPLVVLPGEAALFHASLIHGMGENNSDKIRFSIDFRVFSAYNFEVSKELERRKAQRPAVAYG